MQYLSLDYWRAHSLELWYGIAGFVLFLIFLFATFPYAPAIKGVLAPLGLRFDSAEQELALPFGARLSNVSIRSLTPGTPPIFQSRSVHIWPALGSLLLLRPGISGSAAIGRIAALPGTDGMRQNRGVPEPNCECVSSTRC